MIVKAVKKPIEVYAVQWNGDNQEEVNRFTKGYAKTVDGVLKVQTLDGYLNASIGDYIICGIKGEFYPCKPDIFEETYDLFSHIRNG